MGSTSLDRDFFLGWEAKSEEKPDTPIAVKRVRQAKGHIDWVKDHFKLADTSGVSAVMASPRTTLDTEAKKHTESVFYASLDSIREIAKLAAKALANVRRDVGNASEAIMAEAVLREFKAAKLLPQQLRSRLPPLASLTLA